PARKSFSGPSVTFEDYDAVRFEAIYERIHLLIAPGLREYRQPEPPNFKTDLALPLGGKHVVPTLDFSILDQAGVLRHRLVNVLKFDAPIAVVLQLWIYPLRCPIIRRDKIAS